MSNTSTTPGQIIDMIYTDLVTYAAANAGRVSLTKNPYDLIEILTQRPTGWRLVIHWEGDDTADQRVIAGAVIDNRFRIILDGDIAPTIIPNIALFSVVPGGRTTPLLTILSALRSRVLSYRFPWLQAPINRPRYMGADDKIPLPDGQYLAAYNLAFALYSILSQPDDDDAITLEIPA